MYGKVRDELARRRLERREVETEGVAEVELDVVPAREPFREVRLESAVELDRMHQTNPLRKVVGQHSETRADLEHDVLRVEPGKPVDHAEDVLVDQEVLAEIAVRCDGELHGSEKATLAFAAIRAPSSSGSSPRVLASSATVSTTFAGSFGRPRRICGAR